MLESGRQKAYLGHGADLIKGLVVDAAGEATEGVLVDVVGLAVAELLHGIVEVVVGSSLAELDNVLARNSLGSGAGLEDGSALVNGRRGGGHSQRQESEDSGQLHVCWCLKGREPLRGWKTRRKD